MKITKEADHYRILVSRGELVTFNNCLNEALTFMDDADFQTRVGANKAVVDRLLDQISYACKKMP